MNVTACSSVVSDGLILYAAFYILEHCDPGFKDIPRSPESSQPVLQKLARAVCVGSKTREMVITDWIPWLLFNTIATLHPIPLAW